jgi:hypothetical protein
MAKSDALFAYVAPGNIFAWALMPLRYCMPMNQFVQLNRAVLKATHFPLLFCIYLYEKCFLATDMFEATDLVDKPKHGRFHADPASRSAFFSPSIRVRQESVVGYQKDRALEEVFRRAPETRSQRRHERRKTQTAIRTWMDQHEGEYNSPRNYSTIDSRLSSDWLRRLNMNRERPSRFPRHYSEIRSTASDPADLISDVPYPFAADMYDDGIARRDYAFEGKDNTDGDADGDDELVTNDEDEGDDVTNTIDDRGMAGEEAIDEDYFTTPVATRFTTADLDSPRPPTSRRVPLHTRTLSTNTILYAPADDTRPDSSSSASAWPVTSRPFSRPLSTRHNTPVETTTPVTPAATNRRCSPRRSLYLASRPRSMIDPLSSSRMVRTAAGGGGGGGLTLDIPTGSASSGGIGAANRPPTRRRSLADLTASVNVGAGVDNTPSSLRSVGFDDINLNLHTAARHRHGHNNSTPGSSTMAMLARMKSLEASLGDMVREMRTLRMSVPNTAHNSDGDGDETEDAGDGGVGGSSRHAAAAPSWDRHRQGQVRAVVGSDPTSVSGVGVGGRGQALVEVAVGHGRDRERGFGTRRMRGATVAVAAPVGVPRRGVGSGRRSGVWRSPRGEAGGGVGAGLGIKGAAGRDKGKERERVGEGGGVGGGGGSLSMGASPDDGDELGVAAKGISL